MSRPLPPLRLTGACILRDGLLQHRSVALAHGRITRGPLPEVDLSGYLVLPGIVDLYTLQTARAEAAESRAEALLSQARACAAAGITTAWQPQGWSWEGGRRSPDLAEAMLQELDRVAAALAMDLRLQLVCETHMGADSSRLIATVARHGVDLVLFHDVLTPLLEQMRGVPEALDHHAAGLGVTPEALQTAAQVAAGLAREVPRQVCSMAAGFDRLGVTYGSLGDPDGEARERHSMMGARLAVLPLCRPAAAAAHAMMSPVILSARDLLTPRAPGRSGALSTRDLVAEGLCNALVSDGDPTALLRAAFGLADAGLLPLPRAWALVSANPAEILRQTDRGSLSYGKRADLIVVNPASREVEATISAGRLTHLQGGAEERFRAALATAGLAA